VKKPEEEMEILRRFNVRLIQTDSFKSLSRRNQHPENSTEKSSPSICPAPTRVTFPSASAGESAGEPTSVYFPPGDVAAPVDRMNV
jgi:hypothetical protein